MYTARPWASSAWAISARPWPVAGAWASTCRFCTAATAARPELEQELGAQFRSLDQLLAEADFVCLVVPLSDKTRHLISTRELGLMKSSAILINISRGPVVDEPALIQALQDQTIRRRRAGCV